MSSSTPIHETSQKQPGIGALVTLFLAPAFIFANMYTTQFSASIFISAAHRGTHRLLACAGGCLRFPGIWTALRSRWPQEGHGRLQFSGRHTDATLWFRARLYHVSHTAHLAGVSHARADQRRYSVCE